MKQHKHSNNFVFLWPYSHKDQICLAYWYKFKQDIFKEVKIQMKKDNFFKPLSLFVRFIVTFIVEFNMTLLKTFLATNLDTLYLILTYIVLKITDVALYPKAKYNSNFQNFKVGRLFSPSSMHHLVCGAVQI